MSAPLEICIIEDSQEYRTALKDMINYTPGLTCKHVFANGEKALLRIPSLSPDIVLVDIGLPGISGIEVIKEIKLNVPKIKFMVLTVSEEGDKIFNALSAGASGYLLKSTPPPKIIESIRELNNGGAPMSMQIARKVVASFQQKNKEEENPYEKLLTKREKEVLNELSNGLRYREIAQKLGVSIETIKSHCHSIYEKLHVNTKIEALNLYFNKNKKSK